MFDPSEAEAVPRLIVGMITAPGAWGVWTGIELLIHSS
jgi:hypothetical protein